MLNDHCIHAKELYTYKKRLRNDRIVYFYYDI